MTVSRKAILLPLDKEGRLLLQDRSNRTNKKIFVPWGFFGGGIEEGETEEEALKREIMEELDYNVKYPIYIGKSEGTKKIDGEDYTIELNLFTMDVPISEDEITLKEGAGFKFFELDEADEVLNVYWDKKALSMLRKYLENLDKNGKN